MSHARRLCLSVALLTAVSVPVAVAASPSTPAPSTPTPSTSVTGSSSPSSTPTTAGAPAHIKVDKSFDIVLDSKGVAEADKLPTVNTVFTQAELSQVIPGLTTVSVSGDTQTLTIHGDHSSTLQIVLKRFGTKDAVAAAWQQEKTAHMQRARTNPGLYSFFEGRFGARDAFTDGTNTHVLLNKGDAAGEVWFSGSGFTQLASDYRASRTAFTQKIIPALIQLLADKAAQGVPAASSPKAGK